MAWPGDSPLWADLVRMEFAAWLKSRRPEELELHLERRISRSRCRERDCCQFAGGSPEAGRRVVRRFALTMSVCK